MEDMKKHDEHDREHDREHDGGGDRVKTAREILEERLAGMGPAPRDDAAAQALRKAADSAPDAADARPERAAPSGDLETLKKKAAERDEYFDQLLRTRADFDNFQKRSKKEMAEYRDYALHGVFNDLLAAVDTLDLALRSAGDAREVAPFKKGVEMVTGQLEKILTDRGATRISTEGAFDPRRHEAVMTEERADLSPGTVTGELRRGYTFKDRIIRPAQVKVSRAPEKPDPTGGAPGA